MESVGRSMSENGSKGLMVHITPGWVLKAKPRCDSWAINHCGRKNQLPSAEKWKRLSQGIALWLGHGSGLDTGDSQTRGNRSERPGGALKNPAYSVIHSYVLWLKGAKGKGYKLTPEISLMPVNSKGGF